MRNLTFKKICFCLLTICIYSNNLRAQDKNNGINQDEKFGQLLNEKQKINASLSINDRYKIQIYSGISDVAKKTMSEFKQEFSDLDATIIFNTPNYKVWVGNFRTRIEAERNLTEIKRKYKNVLLIKPNK
ncbi:SPOR domain-containing protein [Flavobacterium restrictum]|uniref:SPOR domain-containing protein n=2 Tax=Flavobacterium restrictum TaxID=2594428 RepID=A0A553DWE9_9FLAO|nr:SPOR domain-containing protein [Flavobacterium restrictum]